MRIMLLIAGIVLCTSGWPILGSLSIAVAILA